MADDEHVTILRSGVEQWNTWRQAHPEVRPYLREADLAGMDLHAVDLQRANLFGACLEGANLRRANLLEAELSYAQLTMANLNNADIRKADLHAAHLAEADLTLARLSRADLTKACLQKAQLQRSRLLGGDLFWTDLRGADLRGADLRAAHLIGANLREADLRGADLSRADLENADLSGADLRWADLGGAQLINTSLEGSKLYACFVYGISAWDAHLEGATRTNLRITPPGEPEITVDNLQVAQFLYLMLHNQEIRAVIDTLSCKVVLILGSFSKKRKPILEMLRDALHHRGYVPVLFDFLSPRSKDTTETISLLARMARFIVADLTDPGSIPYELAHIVPDVHVPIQPLLQEDAATFSMAGDLWLAREMLPVYHYTTPEELHAALPERVIAPDEAKVGEIQRERATALLRSGLS